MQYSNHLDLLRRLPGVYAMYAAAGSSLLRERLAHYSFILLHGGGIMNGRLVCPGSAKGRPGLAHELVVGRDGKGYPRLDDLSIVSPGCPAMWDLLMCVCRSVHELTRGGDMRHPVTDWDARALLREALDHVSGQGSLCRGRPETGDGE